jgi:hypothetical protein
MLALPAIAIGLRCIDNIDAYVALTDISLILLAFSWGVAPGYRVSPLWGYGSAYAMANLFFVTRTYEGLLMRLP